MVELSSSNPGLSRENLLTMVHLDRLDDGVVYRSNEGVSFSKYRNIEELVQLTVKLPRFPAPRVETLREHCEIQTIDGVSKSSRRSERETDGRTH